MSARNRPLLIVLALVVLSPLVMGGGYLVFSKVSGTPIFDEWQCSKGSSPVSTTDGGSYCAPDDEEIAVGEMRDPLGNRPFECHDRWNWTEIYQVEQQADEPDAIVTECLKERLETPDGWKPVPSGWDPGDGHPRDF